jgi:DNA-directed RNA polymerase subunit RPC12/RpoP
MQQPTYRPSTTTGFFCPYCGHAVMPNARLSYPMGAVGQFAPIYRCSKCNKVVGEPLTMVRLSRPNAST